MMKGLLYLFVLFEFFTASIMKSIEQSEENASVAIPRIPARSNGFIPGRDSKKLVIDRFKLFISEFLSDAQLSKSIDVAALGMHKGKPLNDIMDDVYARLRTNLTAKQISELAQAHKGLIDDLDEKSAKMVKARVKRMIVYSFDPAAEQIHKFATKPSMAFALIADTLNERFVGSVKGLIRDVLTQNEYAVLRKHYHPTIFKLDSYNTDESSSPIPIAQKAVWNPIF